MHREGTQKTRGLLLWRVLPNAARERGSHYEGHDHAQSGMPLTKPRSRDRTEKGPLWVN